VHRGFGWSITQAGTHLRVLGAMDEAASTRSRRPGHRPGACFGAASARPRSRKQSAARTALGGSVAVRHDLIASGYRAGAVAIDPPWPFEHYSDRAAHAVTDHYETMTLDEIKCCRSPSWPRRTARCSL
jgi:hypothetical protein